MKLMFRPSFRAFKIFTLVALFALLSFYFLLINGRYKFEVDRLRKVVLNRDEFINEVAGPKDKIYPMAVNYERKDWHDWEFIKYEENRKGPGEQGRPFIMTDPKDIELNEKLFKVEGLNVVVSDKISVNRSIPDTRLPR